MFIITDLWSWCGLSSFLCQLHGCGFSPLAFSDLDQLMALCSLGMAQLSSLSELLELVTLVSLVKHHLHLNSEKGELWHGLGHWKGFTVGSVVKNLPANPGDMGSFPGSGRSPGGRNGNPLQYSCLGNPMDRGAWRAIIHGVTRVEHDLVIKQQQQNH